METICHKKMERKKFFPVEVVAHLPIAIFYVLEIYCLVPLHAFGCSCLCNLTELKSKILIQWIQIRSGIARSMYDMPFF